MTARRVLAIVLGLAAVAVLALALFVATARPDFPTAPGPSSWPAAVTATSPAPPVAP